MQRALFFLISFIMATLLPAPLLRADVIDAPHNQASGVSCFGCHSFSLWWQYSPLDPAAPSYQAQIDSICANCHYGGSLATGCGHSSAAMEEMHNPLLGTWQRNCLDWPDPHSQAQLDWQPQYENELYLVAGVIGTASNFTYAGGKTTFNYTASTVSPNWTDRATWSRKTGLEASRGLIVVVDTVEGKRTYQVVAADASTISIKGTLESSNENKAFGLSYGQFIKSTIQLSDTTNRIVRFFDPLRAENGFVDSQTPPSGICQVCHTDPNTRYWRADGLNTLHNAGSRCPSCHLPSQGFKPVVAFAAHNVVNEGGCDACHGPLDTLAAIEALHIPAGGTDSCGTCHASTRPEVMAAIASSSAGCTDCHAEQPVHQQTETIVGGTISTDTVWDITGSPYRVTSSIIVQGADGADNITTLTIKPGVEVRFNQYTQLTIGASSGNPGALVARGTAAYPILFTSNKAMPAAGDWYGVSFQNTSDDASSMLEYCTIDYAGYGSGALYLYSASPRISNCTIDHSKTQGINVSYASPQITNNLISNSYSNGLYFSSGAPVVTGNTLVNNGSYDIYFTSPSGGSINSNTLNTGLYLSGAGIGELSGNIFNYNAGSLPLHLGADDVGMALTANTFNNVAPDDYLEVVGGTVVKDATWPALMPYNILGTVTVQGMAGTDSITTLTLNPGANLRFNQSTQLTIGAGSGNPGALVAQGTAIAPITFTSSNAVPTPGSWQGVSFQTTANPLSIVDYCILEYGYNNIYSYNAKPTIQNSAIRSASNAGIYLSGLGSNGMTISYNTISDNKYGIYAASCQPIAHYNNFSQNVDYALYYTGSTLLDATENWWDSIDGPNSATGEAVYGNVDFDPWSLSENTPGGQTENHPPAAPASPQPADNAVRVASQPNTTLTWVGGDPDAFDVVTYDLYLGATTGNLILQAQGLPSATHTLVNLSTGATYYWQIIAHDANLATPGPVWRFTTDGPAPDISVAGIVSQPLGNVAVDQEVTFTATIKNIGAGPVVDNFQITFKIDGQIMAEQTVAELLFPDGTVQMTQNWTFAEGDHTVEVVVDSGASVAESDETNNISTRLITDIIDHEPPELLSVSPAVGIFTASVEGIVIVLADRHNNLDTATTAASIAVSDSSAHPVAGVVTVQDSTFTFTPTLALVDDLYQVVCTGIDLPGNAQNFNFSFTKDATPPAKPVITGGMVASGQIQEQPTQNIAHDFAIPLTGTREADTSLWVNGVLAVPLDSIPWSVDLTLLAGNNTLEIWTEDQAGNESARAFVDVRVESENALKLEYYNSGSGRLQRTAPVAGN